MSSRVHHRGEPTGRGIPRTGRFADQRADKCAARVAVKCFDKCSHGIDRHFEVGVADEDQWGPRSGDPSIDGSPVPEIGSGNDHLDVWYCCNASGERAVCRAVVDHDELFEACVVEVEDAPGEGVPRLVVHDDPNGPPRCTRGCLGWPAPGRRLIRGRRPSAHTGAGSAHGSIRVNRYLIRARRAPMPSRQVIFLPSLNSRPA